MGTYLPYIRPDETIDVEHRTDYGLRRLLNARGYFSGRIQNKDNLGRSAEELVALWNADHPEDPVI